MLTFGRIVLGTMAASLTGALIFAGAASAGGVAGTGSVGTCAFTGKAKIKPALIIGGTETPVTTKVAGKLGAKTKAKIACSGGTGDGATVVGGTVKGVINSTGTNDCLALATVGLASFPVTIKWNVTKGSPKLFPTTWNVAATPPGAINLAGPGGSIQITLTGTGAATDAKGKPQSFVGSTITSVATTDETLTDFTAACTPPAKGLKAFNFNGINGPSTLTE